MPKNIDRFRSLNHITIKENQDVIVLKCRKFKKTFRVELLYSRITMKFKMDISEFDTFMDAALSGEAADILLSNIQDKFGYDAECVLEFIKIMNRSSGYYFHLNNGSHVFINIAFDDTIYDYGTLVIC